MYCSNCGAKISSSDTSCPYCQCINPVGAEQAYMKQLHTIEEKTAHISEEMVMDSSRQFLKKLKTVSVIFLICGAAVFLLYGIYRLDVQYVSRHQNRQQQEIISFEQTYFPVLDEKYQIVSDRDFYDYVLSIKNEPGSTGLNYWKHYSYIEELYHLFGTGKED